MSDKQQLQSQSQSTPMSQNPVYSVPQDDEIDLIDLITQLWQKKWWIIGCMFLTTSIAGIYAFTAKEKWTATAVVNEPNFDTVSKYYQGIMLLKGNIDKDTAIDEATGKLFKQFISQASSYNELSNFISQTDYFKKLSEGKSEADIVKLLNQVVEKVTVVKDKTNPIYTFNFPADTAAQANQLLEDYMEVANNNVITTQYEQLALQITDKKNIIKDQMDAFKTIAEEKRQDEIDNIKMAILMAENANIQKPVVSELSKLDPNSLFLLGREALNALLINIKSQPLVLDGAYYTLQRQYINLDTFTMDIDKEQAQAFSYLQSPMEPISRDWPKRPMIILLGGIIGGLLGCGIVLVRDYAKR
jgi:chain length determinant protein (polysaccharide antigen chain regulator)